MRLAEAFLIVAICLGLGGCALRKPPAAKAAPPPPKPAAAPTPAPPPEPLSIPQTNVYLPAPQPLTPEAIATTQLPGEPPPPPPSATRTPMPRPPRPAPAQPRTEPAPPVAAPQTTTEPERQPFSEVVSAGDLKRFQEEANIRASEAKKIIEQFPPQRRNRRQANTISRAEQFLKQAEEAERRHEYRQASELAQRALVLARELKP
jgi:hypothetical protein